MGNINLIQSNRSSNSAHLDSQTSLTGYVGISNFPKETTDKCLYNRLKLVEVTKSGDD